MILDLDHTLEALLHSKAPPGSTLAGAGIRFDLPDAEWRASLSGLTVNCYLYDIRENAALRTEEPILVRGSNGKRAERVRPPVRIDCAYCITAWSPARTESVLEEHRLLGDVLRVLLRFTVIPPDVLKGSLQDQIPPYPSVIASQDGIRNQPEFWHSLDQKLKPSLNYIVTLAVLPDDIPAAGKMTPVVNSLAITAEDRSLAPSAPAPVGPR